MIGGPFMNLLLAFAIPFVGGMIYGVPAMPAPIVATVKSGGAAEQAGIKVGDRIVGFDGMENPTLGTNQTRFDDRAGKADSDCRRTQRTDAFNLTIKPTKEDVKGKYSRDVRFRADMEPVIISPRCRCTCGSKPDLQRGDKAISINGETVNSIRRFQTN